MMRHPDRDVAFAIETLEDEHIGFTGIHQISWRHGTGITGTLIGRKDYWGKVTVRTPFGRAHAMHSEVLGLRMLLSEVLVENHASLKMLLKAGYREVGRIPRRYWKRGAYRDVILLVCERDGG